jgi:hypothetical protein
MAHQMSIVDDFDGATKARNVTFAIDGDVYDIHLSRANERRLRGLLKEFTDTARLRADPDVPADVPVLPPAAPKTTAQLEKEAAAAQPAPATATARKARKTATRKKKSTTRKVAPTTTTSQGQSSELVPATDSAQDQPAGDTPTTAVDSAAVRQWAIENNVPVPPRGRVPQAVVERYRAEAA